MLAGIEVKKWPSIQKAWLFTMKVPPVSHRLSSKFQHLLEFHDAVDRIYCFLVKRKMTCTVSKIEKLYNELVSDASAGSLKFDVLYVCQLCSLCPDTYKLRASDNAADLEFTFGVQCAAATESQRLKRQKIVFDTLSSSLIEKLMHCASGMVDQAKLFSSRQKCLQCIKSSGWPAFFDLEGCPPPSLTEEATHMLGYYQTLSVDKREVASGMQSSENPADAGQHIVEATSIEEGGGAGGVADYIKCQPFYKDQIKHVECLAAREARYADLSPPELPPALDHRLREVLGLGRFYLHQARAIDALRVGKHAVISTSTASGKSVIYNIPVIESVLQDPQVTALYLFPTKALAQDQLRSLLALTDDGAALPVSVAVCDGDTPQHERARIQYAADIGAPNIILTNPDMLHCTLLPDHRNWKRIFENIKFVVVDEAHMYRGAFGSHVAAVLRRLVRVCLYYGRTPQFLCCSATIANPAEHMKRLVPLDALYMHQVQSNELQQCPSDSKIAGGGGCDFLEVIGADLDGAPQGERQFMIWNPPLQRASGPEQDTARMDPFDPNQPSAISRAAFRSMGMSHSGAAKSEAEWSHSRPGDDGIVATLSPKKQRFMQACADSRPATIGPARNLRIADPSFQAQPRSSTSSSGDLQSANPAYEVKYVGCWKRGRSVGKYEASSASLIDGDDGDEEFVVKERDDATSSAGDGQGEGERNLASNAEGSIGAGIPPQIRRVSSIWETANIFTALVKRRLRTLAFCKVRKLVELVLSYSLRNLETSGAAHLMSSVASYRGGYTKEERRSIESDLFSGRLLGVTATNALEVGIDVGTLDATLHMGFPGTFSSMWQQAGRAGRSGRSSLSIIVCFESPIDQYFARHPEVLFHSPVEPAILDVNNIHVLHAHLLCAAEEVSLNYHFSSGASRVFDLELWGGKYKELLQYLVEAKKVLSVHDNGSNRSAVASKAVSSSSSAEDRVEAMCNAQWRAVPASRGRASTISLRMIDPVTISIVDDSRGITIDTLGYSRAFFELYEGAIYMHRAVQYRVHQLDLVAAVAHTRPVKVRYYTTANNRTQVNVLRVEEQDGIMCCGEVQVVRSVYGYTKSWLGSGEPFEQGDCSLPPLEYETCAFWIDLPLQIKHALEAEGLCPFSSMHAANHALLAVAPLHAQCDATDLASEHSIDRSALTQPFRIMIFDLSTGGLGASTALYHNGYEVLRQAMELASSCSCGYATGCPCCTLNSRCSHHNQDLSRRGALRLFAMILELRASKLQEQAHAAATEVGGFFPSPSKTCVPSSIARNLGYAAQQIAPVASQALEASPQKERRRKAIKKSLSRDRAHQMAIQMNWTESVPSFYQDGDV